MNGQTFSKANTCVIETRILPAVIHSDIIKSAGEPSRFIQAINITVYSPIVGYYMAILRASMFGRIIEHIKLHYIIKWPEGPRQRSINLIFLRAHYLMYFLNDCHPYFYCISIRSIWYDMARAYTCSLYARFVVQK